jgi:threonine aldolase
MPDFKRRDFLKLSGLSVLPLLTGLAPVAALARTPPTGTVAKDADAVYFINDGIFYKPADFLVQLQAIQASHPIERDAYAADGTMEKLLRKFCVITGKEAAVYMSSGTLANQLAIHVLGGSGTKAFVQETSHVYRDEGDAAQTLYNKRLVPLAAGKHWFSLEELKASIAYHEQNEAFAVPGTVVSIETPVRRCDNQVVPVDEIKKITAYCREAGYKLHLDGARLHIAAAFTGTPVAEYAKHFDTVYLCLYKYLGATGGAVLCGDKAVIDQMHHLVKIHGGSIFTNWPSAAMALHHLQDIDGVLDQVKEKAASLFPMLNRIEGLEIRRTAHSSNMSLVKIGRGIDTVKLGARLRGEYNIVFGQPRPDDGLAILKANATLLRRGNKEIAEAFKEAVCFARS